MTSSNSTAISKNSQHDLGEQRGLSPATLKLFNVRVNGNGWEWETRTTDGKTATRWKSFHSVKPADDPAWTKYRWVPDKPSTAKYFYPPALRLTEILEDSSILYMVGGEVAAMSMFEAGYRAVTCTFGDNAIPDTLAVDLTQWGVTTLYLIPDRDKSGQKWACDIRDKLLAHESAGVDIELHILALPYPIEDKHGKDVNDWWLAIFDKAEFQVQLTALPEWKLPEREVKPLTFTPLAADTELPQGFVDAILRDVESRAMPNKAFRWDGEGWSSNIRCPFHDDDQASAGFNRESMSFKCFRCDKKSAKEYGERVGIHLKDFYDPLTNIRLVKPALVIAPPEIKKKPEGKRLSPPLPTDARLTASQENEAAQGRRWLDSYLAYTNLACPLAPEIFHEAMALWLLATISTRRMKLIYGGETIFPNLYIVIVAKTSLYRKSTAMKEAKKILRAAGLECLLLPTDVTPEALFDELAGVKPMNFEGLSQEDRRDWLLGRTVAAQRSFIKDECSSVFANLRKDYNAGLTELLLEGYEGDGGKQKKLLKSKGMISVKDVCLSFLGATTPVMYAKYISNEERENGFIARFAVITPEGLPIYKEMDEPVPVPPDVVRQLKSMFMDVLPWHNNERPTASTMISDVITPPATTVTVDPEAMRQLKRYRKALNYDLIIHDHVDENKRASYARLGTAIFKIAMLLAAIGGTDAAIRIQPCHAYAAQMIAERWRESTHRLERDVARSSDSENDKILNYLKSCGTGGATMREIMRDCAIKQRFIVENTLKTLNDDALLEKFEYKPTGAGRPSIRFRVPETASMEGN